MDTQAELLQLKSHLEEESHYKLRDKKTRGEIKIVAEGDSWFDYPLIKDVIDHLRKMGYCIAKNAKAGDTLENMVYGTEHEIQSRKRRVINFGEGDLDETLASVKSYKPRFVLFSAGGNDVVGEEMVFYLDHKRANGAKGLDLVRKDIFKHVVEKVLKPAIIKFCESVWKINPGIDILMDGYDYPIPNGTSYAKISGPWILPGFGAKAIVERKEQDTILKYFVDGFNEMLRSLDVSYPNFHHIDLRGMFPYEHQWHNEIHLRKKEYREVAIKYHNKILEILKVNSLDEITLAED